MQKLRGGQWPCFLPSEPEKWRNPVIKERENEGVERENEGTQRVEPTGGKLLHPSSSLDSRTRMQLDPKSEKSESGNKWPLVG